MDFEEYTKEKLWPALVETAHALAMYWHHKGYVREAILPEKPEITPTDLAIQLSIPLGEALTILYELTMERKPSS
jgi:hypothetical protein